MNEWIEGEWGEGRDPVIPDSRFVWLKTSRLYKKPNGRCLFKIDPCPQESVSITLRTYDAYFTLDNPGRVPPKWWWLPLDPPDTSDIQELI